MGEGSRNEEKIPTYFMDSSCKKCMGFSKMKEKLKIKLPWLF